jgi:hypothetical protein
MDIQDQLAAWQKVEADLLAYLAVARDPAARCAGWQRLAIVRKRLFELRRALVRTAA